MNLDPVSLFDSATVKIIWFTMANGKHDKYVPIMSCRLELFENIIYEKWVTEVTCWNHLKCGVKGICGLFNVDIKRKYIE